MRGSALQGGGELCWSEVEGGARGARPWPTMDAWWLHAQLESCTQHHPVPYCSRESPGHELGVAPCSLLLKANHLEESFGVKAAFKGNIGSLVWLQQCLLC